MIRYLIDGVLLLPNMRIAAAMPMTSRWLLPQYATPTTTQPTGARRCRDMPRWAPIMRLMDSDDVFPGDHYYIVEAPLVITATSGI